MRRTIAVTRTGSPFFVSGVGSSARGDLDTEPVVRHLAARGDCDIVYFGVIRNAEALPDNVRVIDVDARQFDRYSDDSHVEECLKPYVDQLRDMEPLCMIDLFGAVPTWSWVANPNYAMVFDFGIKYSAPALYAIHKLKLPRFGIVTDPKCYKRDMEMGSIWPEIVPQAVLSQETLQFKKSICNTKFLCHAVYAACEYWLTDVFCPEQKEFEKTHDISIASNTHLGENRLPKGRENLWTEILERCDPASTRISGAGWEKHPFYYLPEWRESFVGVLKGFDNVLEHIGRGRGGPMIPQWPGFNSTKPRLYALMGSVPYLYGDGSSQYDMTYDRDARVLPLNHPSRWVNGPPHSYDAQETIELVLKNTVPDYSKLDALVDRILAGTVTYPDPAWLKEFGGYVYE